MDLQATAQLLGNLGEFFGSIAVFMTLAYLAIQVRQARNAANYAAIQENRAQRIAQFRYDRDSPYLPGIIAKMDAGEALTPEEKTRVRFHVAGLFALTYSEWIQQDMGLATSYMQNHRVALRAALGRESHTAWRDSFVLNFHAVDVVHKFLWIQVSTETVPPSGVALSS